MCEGPVSDEEQMDARDRGETSASEPEPEPQPQPRAEPQPAPDAGESSPAAEGGPAHGAVRYSRRRILVLGGALVAGIAAAVAGLRVFGGSTAEKVGGAVTNQFSSFPINSVEDVPDVPADQWVVKVDGLVDTPLTIDRTTWNGLQRTNETVDFHCVEGWSVDDVRWSGVSPSVLFDQAGVKPEAKYAVLHAYSGEYQSSLPLDLMRDSQTMLADQLNGAPLPPKHGGPLRLVVPKQLGYKNVKWVTRIELSAEQVRGYWESNGYPEDAPVHGS
jgi:DMSO/TMAO reductase YedYZ molybdopterin-dependent catalytic subunit